MLKIWGRATSSNVQAVMWTVAELGLEHERVDWGGKHGGNDDPAYRDLCPTGLVPALEDGDVRMFESAAIVRYLGARYGDETFWPADPAKRARLDSWAEWAKTSLLPDVIGVMFMQLVRAPEAQRDRTAVAAAADRLAGKAALLDARLGEAPYLGGEAPCFADVMAGHGLYRYMTLDFPKADTPNLDAYYARLCARPAYAEHVMVSYEELRAK